MKFSILIPVYNVEQFLPECMDSVLQQSFSDYEVVLVDDGSKDSSGRLCDDYAQSNPQTVRVIHKENEGLISARRVGISAAQGEFCVFVDSDDAVEPDLLENLARTLEADRELDIVLYSFRYYDGKTFRARKVRPAPDGYLWAEEEKKALYKKLITTNEVTSIWTKAIRTAILKADPTDYRQYYGKNMAEDLLQSLYPLTVARKVGYLDKPLYRYRINEESISRSYRPETIASKNIVHVYEKIEEYLPIWGLDAPSLRQQLHAQWFHWMMYLFCQYYLGAKNAMQRAQVLSYPWERFLPESLQISEEVLTQTPYAALYKAWKQQDSWYIRRYFAKAKLERKWKQFRRRINSQ